MSNPTPIRTGAVRDRRALNFTTVDEILRDVDAIEAASRAGRLRRTGNWTAGQIFQHVGRVIESSYGGPSFRAPLPVRMVGRILKTRFIGRPAPAGLAIPKGGDIFAPDESVSDEAGAAYLRRQLARLHGPERCAAPSPVFGPMTHEDWIKVHLGHSSLHFSFLHPQ